MLRKVTALVCSFLIAIGPVQAQQPNQSATQRGSPDGLSKIPDHYLAPLASYSGVENSYSYAGPAGTLVPDQFNGSLRYSIAFPLPPLRGFEPPAPTVIYNSYSERAGAGFGWNIDIGYIG